MGNRKTNDAKGKYFAAPFKNPADCLKVWMHVSTTPGGKQAAALRNICRK
jgi:hypothetical protein